MIKNYKTATDRLTAMNLGMAVVINVENDWRGVGGFTLWCNAIANAIATLYS